MNIFFSFVFLNYFDLVCRFHLYKPESFRIFPFAKIDDYNEDGVQPVHLAVEMENLSATMTLIERFGASPTAETRQAYKDIPKGSTAFTISITKNNLEIFQYLLSKMSKRDLEQHDEQLKTPLHLAAQIGNATMVETILSITNKIGFLRQTRISPLHLALAEGHIEIVRIFAEANLGFGPVMDLRTSQKASICHLESTLFYLARQKHELGLWTELWTICSRVLNEDAFVPHKVTRKTILDAALEEENDEIAALLIFFGADLKRHIDSRISTRQREFFIDLNGFFFGSSNEEIYPEFRGTESIWHICARHNALFFVKALIHRFPELKTTNFVAQPDKNENVLPVEIATKMGFEGLAVELVKLHGLEIEASVLETLVCSAALGSQYRVLEALIDQFPDAFLTLMTSSRAVQPLHILATSALSHPKDGHKEIILLLLKKYPFALARHDRLGRTPLHLALECNFIDFFVWLRDARDREDESGPMIDFDVQNSEGYSFLKLLHDENCEEIINIISNK